MRVMEGVCWVGEPGGIAGRPGCCRRQPVHGPSICGTRPGAYAGWQLSATYTLPLRIAGRMPYAPGACCTTGKVPPHTCCRVDAALATDAELRAGCCRGSPRASRPEKGGKSNVWPCTCKRGGPRRLHRAYRRAPLARCRFSPRHASRSLAVGGPLRKRASALDTLCSEREGCGDGRMRCELRAQFELHARRMHVPSARCNGTVLWGTRRTCEAAGVHVSWLLGTGGSSNAKASP